MATLNRTGVDIYYEVHGSGPAILLTHGFSATSQMWQGQIEPLSKNHTLILWDMRGHGRSGSPTRDDQYSEALTVGDMAALLDELGFDRAIIGGLSLGGYMSLAFHAQYPERVEALLAIDTGPGYKSDTAREAWNKQAEKMASRIEERGAQSLSSGSPERSTSVHEDISGVALAGRNMLTQHSSVVIESLPNIQVPTLVVVGADDEPYLIATDYMVKKIPGAQKVVIQDAGHAVNIDQPQAFNKAVEAFLESLD